MTRIVVCNVEEPTSRGDHAALRELLDLLPKRNVTVEAIAREPRLCSAAYGGLVTHEQPGKAVAGPRAWQRLVHRWRLFICAVTPWFKTARKLLPARQQAAVEALLEADVVIASPGGYLAGTPGAALMQLWLAAMSRRRLVLAPMSIGPIEGGLSRWMLARILARAERVFVREYASDAFCRDLGYRPLRSNDLVFLNPRFRSPLQAPTTQPRHIAVSAADWSFAGPDRKAAILHYVEKLSTTVIQLAERTGLDVKIVAPTQSDLSVSQQLASAPDSEARIVPEVNTPERLQAFLSAAYCLVTSHFHVATVALSVGCPVVLLTHLPREAGMLSLYGLEDLCFPVDAFDAGTLVDTLSRWGSDRVAFRHRCASLQDSLQNLGDPFVTWLDGLKATSPDGTTQKPE